jgi:hypothetical protein
LQRFEAIRAWQTEGVSLLVYVNAHEATVDLDPDRRAVFALTITDNLLYIQPRSDIGDIALPLTTLLRALVADDIVGRQRGLRRYGPHHHEHHLQVARTATWKRISFPSWAGLEIGAASELPPAHLPDGLFSQGLFSQGLFRNVTNIVRYKI